MDLNHTTVTGLARDDLKGGEADRLTHGRLHQDRTADPGKVEAENIGSSDVMAGRPVRSCDRVGRLQGLAVAKRQNRPNSHIGRYGTAGRRRTVNTLVNQSTGERRTPSLACCEGSVHSMILYSHHRIV